MGRYKWSYKYRVTVIITHIRGLITPLTTTHEPPSRDYGGILQPLFMTCELGKAKTHGILWGTQDFTSTLL